jgi:hypothetical protein
MNEHKAVHGSKSSIREMNLNGILKINTDRLFEKSSFSRFVNCSTLL